MAVQTQIPGTEHPHNDKQLDEMLAARRKTSKTRKKWQDREVEEGTAIEKRMADKGYAVYVNHSHTPPLIAKLNTKSKLVIDEYDDGSSDMDDDEPDQSDAPAAAAEAGDQKASKKRGSAEA